MSSHETRVWETPNEENLASLMGRASKLIAPSDSYSLELKLFGVQPNRRLNSEMEAQFGAYLDREKGSELHLAVNGIARALVLNRFSASLAGDCGQINLQRTNAGRSVPHKFIPSVDLMGQTLHARYSAWQPEWHVGLAQKIMEGHSLPVMTPEDAPADYYHAWLGDRALARSKSWWLQEKIDIHQSAMGNFVTRISFGRRQSVPEDALLSSETLSIIHETTDLEEMTTTKQRLDLISHQDVQRFVRTTITTAETDQKLADRDYRGADEQDITHFTGLVERALSQEN